MLSARAEALVRDEQATRSDSMTLNLRKWLGVMDTYVAGGFSYYTTMPTDCLRLFRDAAFERASTVSLFLFSYGQLV
jgi:aspartate aminotransferase-like enzyme